MGARTLAKLRPSPLFMRMGSWSDEVIANHRYEPGRRLFHFPTNSRGSYDDELERKPGHALVVAIGDSFNLGIVPHPFHYTTVAERLVPGLVIDSVGIDGIGPPEYAHLLEAEVLPVDPDAILLCLFLGNDLTGTDLQQPAARLWYDRDNVYLHLRPWRLLALAREDTARTAPGSTGPRPPTDPPPAPQELLREFPWLADPWLETPDFSHDAFLRIEKARLGEAFRTDDLSRYEKLFSVLDHIQRESPRGKLFVLLIPTEMQVEAALWHEVLAAAKPRFDVDLDQPQRIVGAWLEERGIPHLDPLPRFRSVPPLEDGQRHLFHARNTHLNVRGNEVLGEALAEFLRPWLEERSASLDRSPGS